MKTKPRMKRTLFAIVTAAAVASCGADDKKDKTETEVKDDKTDMYPVVEMKTSLGSFKIQLDREKAPITVNNFLKYVEKKHYDGTIFHRVIKTFMVQGGGFVKGSVRKEKPTMPPIKNEARTSGLKNDKYTIAMARTFVPDSATSQFFINVVDNGYRLDPRPGPRGAGYAVFGKVIEGKENVDKIRDTPTIKGSPEDSVPVKQVVIESVRLVKKKAEDKKKDGEKAEKKDAGKAE